MKVIQDNVKLNESATIELEKLEKKQKSASHRTKKSIALQQRYQVEKTLKEINNSDIPDTHIARNIYSPSTTITDINHYHQEAIKEMAVKTKSFVDFYIEKINERVERGEVDNTSLIKQLSLLNQIYRTMLPKTSITSESIQGNTKTKVFRLL